MAKSLYFISTFPILHIRQHYLANTRLGIDSFANAHLPRLPSRQMVLLMRIRHRCVAMTITQQQLLEAANALTMVTFFGVPTSAKARRIGVLDILLL